MRKIIAALVVSVDGFIEGPNGELDWVDSWEDPFDLLPQIDSCILGRGMYPGYERYWGAILADPKGILPFTGKVATKSEIDYAHFAERTPHIVLSRTLDKVSWKNTRIVRDVEEIRRMKQQPGKDMHAVGGAALVCSSDELSLDRRAPAGGAPPHPRWGKSAVQGRKGTPCANVSRRQAVGIGLGSLVLQHVT